jgi:hypothetical protein
MVWGRLGETESLNEDIGGGTFCVRNGVSSMDAMIDIQHEAHYVI